jgi:hypothetical protein
VVVGSHGAVVMLLMFMLLQRIDGDEVCVVVFCVEKLKSINKSRIARHQNKSNLNLEANCNFVTDRHGSCNGVAMAPPLRH